MPRKAHASSIRLVNGVRTWMQLVLADQALDRAELAAIADDPQPPLAAAVVEHPLQRVAGDGAIGAEQPHLGLVVGDPGCSVVL
jgi:hypothetical protein